MKKHSEANLNHPFLLLVAGNFDRKPRTLDRDVMAIGRARGSDLCLEANEISTLHCIIYRSADSYRIRDCNSRTGTRINGAAAKNQPLHDGDIVNLGPFSFEFRVPHAVFPRDACAIDPVKITHVQDSRFRLAQHALRLRKRLGEADHGASAREADLAHKANMLKDKIRSYDHRLQDLEEAEKELTDEHAKLAREHEAHRTHVQQMEGKLAARLAKTEEEIHQRWQEFQLRCQSEEARLRNLAVSAPIQDAVAQPAHDHIQQQLLEAQQHLADQQQQLNSERQEFLAMKEQWVRDQTQSADATEEHKAALAQQETALRTQKAELVRMMGNLKKMQEDLRKQAKGDVRLLHEENERLQHENAELQTQLANTQSDSEVRALLEENDKLRAAVQELEHQAAPAVGVDELHAAVGLLREELERKNAELEQVRQHPPISAGNDDDLRAENELLKKLLQEKNQVVEEMDQKSQQRPKTSSDLEQYEVELNEYRRQLDADRAKLSKEVELLRERNKELDDAVREMEMEMSKERAELGRERIRLERVRDDIKTDMERMQREIAVRDSMAPVQKLREEITGKPTVPGKTEKALNDRLRGFRNQLSDKPS